MTSAFSGPYTSNRQKTRNPTQLYTDDTWLNTTRHRRQVITHTARHVITRTHLYSRHVITHHYTHALPPPISQHHVTNAVTRQHVPQTDYHGDTEPSKSAHHSHSPIIEQNLNSQEINSLPDSQHLKKHSQPFPIETYSRTQQPDSHHFRKYSQPLHQWGHHRQGHNRCRYNRIFWGKREREKERGEGEKRK